MYLNEQYDKPKLEAIFIQDETTGLLDNYNIEINNK